MAYFEVKAENNPKASGKKRFYKKRWFRVVGILLLLLLLVGGALAWKTGMVLNKISTGGLLRSLIRSIPGIKNEVEGEIDGRINILLLGMRGENMPGGGRLADTIIVASMKPQENKVSMISIPRDLYVTAPGTQDKQKINAIYAYGEVNDKKQGLANMKTVVSEVTGLSIHYAVSTNFSGFKQLVDAIGGLDITLDKPFEEPIQFNEPHVCDSETYTVPTGEFDTKKKNVYWPGTKIVKRVRITAQYPLCTNPNVECGGDFRLPAGQQTLSGPQALCYVRSRFTTSDFDRNKRQQVVIELIKQKLLSAGTLSNFEKLNGIADSLGDNVRSDMQPWEIKRIYELYTGMQNPQVFQRVLENSEEGLLYNPPMTEGSGYILLPIGDNYDKIHEMSQNIFTLSPQTDIKPK
ncbi:MAG: LCP family protein [Patescibacteria group bacterium]